jgi:hypothetical protein
MPVYLIRRLKIERVAVYFSTRRLKEAVPVTSDQRWRKRETPLCGRSEGNACEIPLTRSHTHISRSFSFDLSSTPMDGCSCNLQCNRNM